MEKTLRSWSFFPTLRGGACYPTVRGGFISHFAWGAFFPRCVGGDFSCAEGAQEDWSQPSCESPRFKNLRFLKISLWRVRFALIYSECSILFLALDCLVQFSPAGGET